MQLTDARGTVTPRVLWPQSSRSTATAQTPPVTARPSSLGSAQSTLLEVADGVDTPRSPPVFVTFPVRGRPVGQPFWGVGRPRGPREIRCVTSPGSARDLTGATGKRTDVLLRV